MLTQLVCLHVTFSHNVDAAKEVASVGKLTSLEDLRIHFRDVKWSTRRLMKELSSLRELRVLIATTYYDEDSERDFLESLRQLPKLQTLVLIHSFDDNEIPAAKWETEFALPRRLQHLAVNGVATSVEELAAISSDERDVVPVDVEYLRDLINHSYLTWVINFLQPVGKKWGLFSPDTSENCIYVQSNSASCHHGSVLHVFLISPN